MFFENIDPEKTTAVMGNQNTGPPKGPDAVSIQKEDDLSTNSSAGSVSRDRPPGPSAELLNSLQSLGEHSDYTLLPQSLHQIAETYSLKEDYQWAVQFLQLEKLYHERLLSNLSALQEDWESQWKEKKATESSVTNSIDEEHIEVLGQICRTHHRPSLRTGKSISDTMLTDIQSILRQRDMKEMVPPQHDQVNDAQMAHRHEDEEDEEEEQQSMTTQSETSTQQCAGRLEGAGREEDQPEEDEEEAYEEGLEAEEDEDEEEEGVDGEVLGVATPEEEQVNVEWPAGVPQASVKDLVKLSHKEGSSSPDGLVSILKRRRASLDGLPPSGPADTKSPSKRKVRFIEPEDAMEHDEVGGDSCLILLLLCLVTVVISIGGTALYCTLVDTYSNICTDFSHNMDFYVMNVRRFLDELRRWLPLWT